MKIPPGALTLTAKVTSSSLDSINAPPDLCSGDPVEPGGHDEGKKTVPGSDLFEAPKKVVLRGLFGSGI
jgi:hypothetical protein